MFMKPPRPRCPPICKRPAILVFSKTNAFRHEEAIPAGKALFAKLAKDKGWGHFQTENGAAFTPEILARFDAVVFNNASGDVFTPDPARGLQGLSRKRRRLCRDPCGGRQFAQGLGLVYRGRDRRACSPSTR